MRGAALVGAALLLAGCHRSSADVTLDTDETQRNATAAKTLADLAAADAASRSPLPHAHPATRAAPQPDADDSTPATPDVITNE